MNRSLALLATLLGGCTAAQSARVLAPDRSSVTAAMGRTTETGDGSGDDVIWSGQVMVRHGLAPKVDGGITLFRTPGTLEQVSAFAMDARVQLTPPEAGFVVTLGGGLGLLWTEQQGGDGLDFELQDYLFAPTLHLGFDVSSTAELVIAPRLVVLFPQGGGERETAYNASIGLRFHDAARTWAIHPELNYAGVLDEDEHFLTLGVSVSAGN